MKNAFNSFAERKYLLEPNGLWTFYASVKYIKTQTEKYGFVLKEFFGHGQRERWGKIPINKELFSKYISPWISYVFEKVR